MSLLTPLVGLDVGAYRGLGLVVLALALFVSGIVLTGVTLFSALVLRVIYRVRFGVWTPPYCSLCASPRASVDQGWQTAGGPAPRSREVV